MLFVSVFLSLPPSFSKVVAAVPRPGLFLGLRGAEGGGGEKRERVRSFPKCNAWIGSA